MNELTRRDFVRGGLTAGIGIGIAPELLRSAVARQAPATPAPGADPYALVDPELLAAIKQFPFPTQTFTSEILAAARNLPPVPPLPPPAPQPFERHIPGPSGAPDLRLVIVDPAPGTKGRPAFLHMHGGGFVSGIAGQFNPFLQAVAQNCGCLVVSVDYRLAPETHFPGSLEDNYTALRWLYKNSDELGVDRKRIAIGGESAGGEPCRATRHRRARSPRNSHPVSVADLSGARRSHRQHSPTFAVLSDSSFGTRARIVSAGLLFSASRPARLRFRPARFLRASKISPDFLPHSSASALSICLWMKMSNTPAA